MRIIFIGCVKFSFDTLKKLIDLNLNLVGVCTSNKSNFNSDFLDLKPLCKSNSIKCLTVDDINSEESVDWIKDLKPDVIFCFGWSALIKKEVLKIPPLGVVGYHPTNLPRNRGRHPIIWAIALGLEKSASTFFLMDQGADSGDVISQVDFEITYDDNAQNIYDRITEIAIKQIESFVPFLEKGTIQRIKQNDSKSNYWRKRNENDGLIDFRMSSRNIYNLTRALYKPYVGAHIKYRGRKISIWKVKEINNSNENLVPGSVLKVYENNIIVKSCDGAVEIIEHDFKILPVVGEFL